MCNTQTPRINRNCSLLTPPKFHRSFYISLSLCLFFVYFCLFLLNLWNAQLSSLSFRWIIHGKRIVAKSIRWKCTTHKISGHFIEVDEATRATFSHQVFFPHIILIENIWMLELLNTEMLLYKVTPRKCRIKSLILFHNVVSECCRRVNVKDYCLIKSHWIASGIPLEHEEIKPNRKRPRHNSLFLWMVYQICELFKLPAYYSKYGLNLITTQSIAIFVHFFTLV